MSAVANCKQELYSCTPREKPWLAHWLMQREEGQTLIFCRTKRGADELERILRRGGHSVGVLHSDRTQGERNQSLARFRDGSVRVLVATDLASRGLDIDGIARVVNFDVPPTAEDYLHRIGRTARAQRAGTASTFVTLEDLGSVRSIESVTKQRIPSIFVKSEDLLALARELSQREIEPRVSRPHGPTHGRGAPRSHGGHSGHSSHSSHGGHGGHGRSPAPPPDEPRRDPAPSSHSHGGHGHAAPSHDGPAHGGPAHPSHGGPAHGGHGHAGSSHDGAAHAPAPRDAHAPERSAGDDAPRRRRRRRSSSNR
jgi:superfamily II DNA/RNA helicase